MLLESIEFEQSSKGASGFAKIAAGGSSFSLRLAYLEALEFPADRLKPGLELGEEESALLELAEEATEAESRAAALLARAEQSSFGLRRKLLERGFSGRAAALALGRLTELGLLSDRRYAESWARSRLGRPGRRPAGPASLLAELRARGIDEAEARAAIAALLGPEERRAALEKAAKGLAARSSGDRDELRRGLRSLGFGSEEIRAYFEEGEA